MYSFISTAQLIKMGFTDHGIRLALKCCLTRLARGRYVTAFVCTNSAHDRLWEPLRNGAAQEFVEFGDIRDKAERLKVLIRARADHLERRTLAEPGRRSREIFSHQSAALIHELPLAQCLEPRVEVVRSNVSRRYANLLVRRRRIPDAQLTRIGIYPVTTLERTLIDIARDCPLTVSVPMIDFALRKRRTSVEAIRNVLSECAEVEGLHSVEAALELADCRRESVAESLCAVGFHEHGVVGFVPQVNVYDSSGGWLGRVDFCHEQAKVIVEVDGIGKYFMGSGVPRKELEKERIRESALSAAGYRVIRLTWKQLFQSVSFLHVRQVVASRLSQQRSAV